MASVTGITADLSAQIEADSVVQAVLSPAGDLILIMAGGTQINAGPLGIDPSVAVTAGIATLQSFDTVTRDVVVPIWHTGSPPPVALVTMDAGITSAGFGISWSPDSNYVSIGQALTPFIATWKRTGDNLTKLANPAILPTNVPGGLSWSSNGLYLAVSHSSSPYLTVYKRSGDVLTKLPDPGDLPNGTGDARWSPDSTYLAVGCSSSPWYNVFKRYQDTLTNMQGVVLGLPSSATSILWSNGGQYLFLGTGATANLDRIYVAKRSADTFTKISNAFSEQPSTGVTGISITPDDRYLAVSCVASPGIMIYRRNGDVFTRLPSSAISFPTGASTGVNFTPDGRFLVVTSGVNPYLSFYRRDGETFTNMLPVNSGSGNIPLRSPAYSPDGVYLLIATIFNPYTIFLKSALGSVSAPVIKPLPLP